MPQRVLRVDQRLHRLVEHPPAVRLPHLQLALDNPRLPHKLLLGNRRRLEAVREQLHGQLQPLGGAVDVVSRAIAGGEGVGASTQRIEEALAFLFRPLAGGPQRDEMLDEVADSRPQVAALERGSRIADEAARCGHGRSVVFPNQDRHAVGQSGLRHTLAQRQPRKVLHRRSRRIRGERCVHELTRDCIWRRQG